ncbi:lysophospholipid acyltransferase family protein [Bacteroidota bacterium]
MNDLFQKIVFYGIIYPLILFAALFPMWLNYRISDALFLLAYYIVGYRKKVVYKNLYNAFPEKSEYERKIIAKKFYRHFCDFIVESVALFHISKKTINRMYVYKNLHIIHDLYKKEKSFIIVCGHYGNWEYMANLALFCNYKLYALYKKLHNKYLDNYIKKSREKFGLTLVDKNQVLKLYIHLKEKNEISGTLFLGDQTPANYKRNHWMTFLNQPTLVYTGTEKLAKKYDLAIVFFDIQKMKRGLYHIFIYLLYENPGETGENEITEGHTRFLEGIIKKRPEFWLWSHRRWKHTVHAGKYMDIKKENKE